MSLALKNYFAITKREWNGMLVLAVIIFVILFAPDVYQLLSKPEPVNFSRIKAAQKILDQAREEVYPKYNYPNNNYVKSDAPFSREKLKITYFSFDPNNLPVEQWKKLGLSDRQIKVIKNYEAKGGKFYKKEDLKKIYSVTSADYVRLEAYINIPERNFSKNYPAAARVFKSKPMVLVEINQADSAELTTIKGVGPAFANRILKYRNRLGGFYKKTQLMEVYGLDSAKFEEIEKQVEINASDISKININTCSFDDLKRNPYLNFKQMNAIIQYRKQHGNFNSIKDLKNIVILNEEVLNKIEPYLDFK